MPSFFLPMPAMKDWQLIQMRSLKLPSTDRIIFDSNDCRRPRGGNIGTSRPYFVKDEQKKNWMEREVPINLILNGVGNVFCVIARAMHYKRMDDSKGTLFFMLLWLTARSPSARFDSLSRFIPGSSWNENPMGIRLFTWWERWRSIHVPTRSGPYMNLSCQNRFRTTSTRENS